VTNPALTPAAAEALAGPFSVEYHDNWPDMYSVSGHVPGEDEEENTVDDERGRHDVRRRAIELLPEALALLKLAHALMLDADDRGELDADDQTSVDSRKLFLGTRALLDSINAAAAPHEIEPVGVRPQDFRAWLQEVGMHPAGLPDSPYLNPVALFLEQKHGGPTCVEDGIVHLADATKKRTLPYMDRFLSLIGRVCGGPISGTGAMGLLDEVLAGTHHDGQAELPL
jgi:hypothetical protein